MVAALDAEAGALLAAAAAVVVVAAGAAAAAPGRVGAGWPRDSAYSRRRVLITPSRDAIWRSSEAIIACSAVGGGGGWTGSLPPLRPLEPEQPRAAPSLMVAGGSPARNDGSAVGGQPTGWPPPLGRPSCAGRKGGCEGRHVRIKRKGKEVVAQLVSLTTCRYTTRGLKNT